MTDLINLDRAIINKVRTGFGLAAHDMKEIIFLPSKWFGMDIKSFQLTDLEATIRELECGLNGKDPHCQAMRARMQAWTDRPRNQGKGKWLNLNKNGLIESNVRKAAVHGIFLRDKRHQFCNIMVDIIYRDLLRGELASKMHIYGPIGHNKYRQDSTGVLGQGNQQLLRFSTNSPKFHDLRKFIERKKRSDSGSDWRRASTWETKSGNSVGWFGLDQYELAERAGEALDTIKQGSMDFHRFYEWRGNHRVDMRKVEHILDFALSTKVWHCPNIRTSTSGGTDAQQVEEDIYDTMVTRQRVGERDPPPTTGEDQILECMRLEEVEDFLAEEEDQSHFHNNVTLLNEEDLANAILNSEEGNGFLDATGRIRHESISPNQDASKSDQLILDWFEDKQCPFFVASDGGNLTKHDHGVDRGASAVALGAPFMESDETFCDIIDCWMEREPIIFIVRISLLPQWLGDTRTSSIQSEASGFCDLGTLLYKNPPQISILDSNATVFNARSIRDNPAVSIRRQVRGAGVAAGKSYSMKMRSIFKDWTGEACDSIRGLTNAGQWNHLKVVHQQLQAWSQEQEGKRVWRLEYFDSN